VGHSTYSATDVVGVEHGARSNHGTPFPASQDGLKGLGDNLHSPSRELALWERELALWERELALWERELALWERELAQMLSEFAMSCRASAVVVIVCCP